MDFVYIYSVANPELPVKLSEAISPEILRRCDPVIARDSVAYATLKTTGSCGGTRSVLAVYNIADIAHPFQKNAVTMNEPLGLGFEDSTLYVCDAITGLNVFNISDQYNPIKVKNYTDQNYIDVIPYNKQLLCWINDGLLIFDISAARNPVKIAKIN